MASLFHWLLCCLCISNILLIISNMVESLGALEVILFMITIMMLMIMMQVRMPGYLIIFPAFFVSSHVFLSTTVMITVAITIERYQVNNDISQPLSYSLSLKKKNTIHFRFTFTFRHCVVQPNIASAPPAPEQLWPNMLSLHSLSRWSWTSQGEGTTDNWKLKTEFTFKQTI